MMIDWPSRLNLAQLPTPVTRLEKYSAQLDGVNLWVKRDELTGTEVSGNKIRKLEFTIAEALNQSCDTLITCGGLQSNHCRATAILATRLGLKVHLILRGSEPDTLEGNLFLDYLTGATITYLPQDQWRTHETLAREIQQDYSKGGNKAYFIPIGASDEVGLWGYIAACQELQEDFETLGFEPEYIVTATGSGGTQGGLIVGAELFKMSSQVLAFNVCDDAAYFERKIRSDITLWMQRYKQEIAVGRLKINTVEGYVGQGYGIASAEVLDTIADLARLDGIFLDPVYTGKAFHGMVSEIRRGEQGKLAGAENVLFIHTGGLFGLFPQQQYFQFGK
ncbi:MAG: D-cysteine desulfhydrase family protein [Gammaproteobacteria bacterium]|jgi:D-cysteine desulfhydrase|nr:D-cysteine desulfhydrase [Gammaproteobacteria bacterium]MDP6095984.1 D-cysteine desulfhydrase family protein [Gammaproteobacteria bacterium]HJO11674.1 D-cysteine desulfhydrase family protein [Gammaproteobacteria bacterium]|tara:strand:- start:203 stop:1207 length:1005 start_codon:yes stop_codon:yes gene_type:complete